MVPQQGAAGAGAAFPEAAARGPPRPAAALGGGPARLRGPPGPGSPRGAPPVPPGGSRGCGDLPGAEQGPGV